MTDLPILIREYRESDKAFILDSWVNSAVYSTPSYWWIPQKVVRAKYRAMIDTLIDARPELFKVLVNETDEDQIFAWGCGDGQAVHFLYVKEEFRHEGLGDTILEDLMMPPFDIIVTSWTNICEKMTIRTDIKPITYKPSLFKELINGINQTALSSTKQERDVPKQDIQQRNQARRESGSRA